MILGGKIGKVVGIVTALVGFVAAIFGIGVPLAGYISNDRPKAVLEYSPLGVDLYPDAPITLSGKHSTDDKNRIEKWEISVEGRVLRNCRTPQSCVFEPKKSGEYMVELVVEDDVSQKDYDSVTIVVKDFKYNYIWKEMDVLESDLVVLPYAYCSSSQDYTRICNKEHVGSTIIVGQKEVSAMREDTPRDRGGIREIVLGAAPVGYTDSGRPWLNQKGHGWGYRVSIDDKNSVITWGGGKTCGYDEFRPRQPEEFELSNDVEKNGIGRSWMTTKMNANTKKYVCVREREGN